MENEFLNEFCRIAFRVDFNPLRRTYQLNLLILNYKHKDLYEREVQKWMRIHSGRRLTIFEVAEMYGKAFVQVATMRTAMYGFIKAGIYPINRNILYEQP